MRNQSDFLEIKLRNQPNPPAPPTFTAYDVIFEGNHGEIKQKSGNLVRQNCLLPTPWGKEILRKMAEGARRPKIGEGKGTKDGMVWLGDGGPFKTVLLGCA